ncbi:MAG: DGQHR domain-containing protein [Thaumarchaeota archaeon]|nr:DGQHR domain-containing protein [Nitrososphaerota archaeon]
MTTPYPALRGKFGTTTYYVVTMRVSELVKRVQFPADLPEWEDLSLDGQFQRKLDDGRIGRHIAPYFATDERRFSGSLVVAIRGLTGGEFEGLRAVARGALSLAYDATADDMGFLILDGQRLIPLDGQHRAKAFQKVLQADVGAGLYDDKISVIIVKFDESHSRYIFNKINKYAKPTSKATNLLVNDDDAMAVTARNMIKEGVIPQRLVNTEINALNKNAPQFTTLATFYDANKALLPVMPIRVMGRAEDMGEAERQKIQRDLTKEWDRLISGIDGWKRAVANPDESGDKDRMRLRETSILGRPIGQLALVRGYAYAYDNMEHADKDAIVSKLNRINWGIGGNLWRGLLVKPNGRMMYGSRVATTASRVIAHMVGTDLPKPMTEKILDSIYGGARSLGRKLPPRIAI